MRAYYNENDKFAAAWLRNLIAAGLTAPGDVDERSIEAVQPDDLKGYVQCHFFAGIGVWSYALRAAGWPDDSAVWTGSCPCQGFSASGKRGGFSDQRHLWPAWFRLIGECRPHTVFGEQVASGDGLAWLDVVLSDLEGAGYTCGAADLCAAGFDSDQARQRLYFVSYAACSEARPTQPKNGCHETLNRHKGQASPPQNRRPFVCDGWTYRIPEPPIPFVVDGFAGCVDQISAIGNALCAPVAEGFIRACRELGVGEKA